MRRTVAGARTRAMASTNAAMVSALAGIPAATDENSGDTLTYSMEGTDAGSFNFNASTRQITTKAGVTYNFEAKSSYSVTIKVEDGDGSSDTVAVTINLTDVVETPGTAHCNPSDTKELWCASLAVGTKTVGAITSYGYADSFGTIFGSVAPSTFTYRTATIGVLWLAYEPTSLDFNFYLTSGTAPPDGLLGANNFSLEIGTGGTKISVPIDNPGTDRTLVLSNQGLSWSAGDTVPLKLVLTNTVPVFPDTTLTRSIAENTAVNTNVGAPIPEGTDADSDTLTYSMEGTDAASFNFNASTRQITTKAGVTHDFETKPSYSVTIKAHDGNRDSDTVAVTINLTEVVETPGTAHCNPSDTKELWCATMTVGSGIAKVGFLRGARGSVAPSTFKGDDEGTVESTMTGVYPYARLDLNNRVSAWGLVGVGSGEL